MTDICVSCGDIVLAFLEIYDIIGYTTVGRLVKATKIQGGLPHV
jgi:hypothetical protein